MDIMICTDCSDAVEFSDDDLGYTHVEAQQKKMLAYDPTLAQMRLVSRGEEHDDAFSTRTCDACGSFMAGARMAYTKI